MKDYIGIFKFNKKWVSDKKKQDPDYFTNLAQPQKPEYLYIGCSDSRIHASDMMGMKPGEIFVHRNIANMVISSDLSAAAVINYAVEHLKVKHIIVCGHYNCGGIKAAMTPQDFGILNPWLRSIRDVYRLHQDELEQIDDENERYNRLTELNVQEQCVNVLKMAEVQRSYMKTGYPQVHGWVVNLETGYLKDLKLDFDKILHYIQHIYKIV